MKKLILTTAILALGCAAIAQTNYQDNLVVTNLYISSARYGSNSSLATIRFDMADPAGTHTIPMYHSKLGEVTIGPGPVRVLGNITTTSNLNVVQNLSVTGNIVALGTITGATNILNVTNVFSTTNSFYYPTNAQTAVVNLGTTYGDYQVDGSAPIDFSINQASKVADVYQTACVLVRNTSGNVTNITGANIHFQGTPFVTNRTVVTFFYHGLAGDLFTNATCLPLW